MASESSRADGVEPGAWTLLFLLMALGLGLRLLGLGESAYYDEVWSMAFLDAPGLAEFWRLQYASDPPSLLAPIYPSLLYGWGRLAGVSLVHARLFSVFFGTLTIPVVFSIGRRLFGLRAGLLASLFLSISILHVYYSLEVRMYSLAIFLSAVSVYSLLRAVDRQDRASWALHGAVNVLLIWTHLYACLIPVAQGLFVLLFHRRNRRLLIAWSSVHAGIFGLLAAWMAVMWSREVGSSALWFVPPGVSEVANAFVVFAGGRFTNWDPSPLFPGQVSLDVVLAVVVYGLIAQLSLVTDWRGRARMEGPLPAGREAVGLLLFWLVVPTLAVIAVSLALRPFFIYRYQLPSSLAVFVLLGGGISRLASQRARVAVAATVALLLAYQLLVLSGPMRPDYKGLARHLEAHIEPGDAILALKDHNAESLVVNSRFPEERVEAFMGLMELYERCGDVAGGGHAAWVVLWRWDRLEDFEAHFASRGLACKQYRFGGLPPLYLYRIQDVSDPQGA